MRILVITTDYPPTRGGISRLSWMTTRSLHELGHDVLVIASGRNQPGQAEFDSKQPFKTVRITSMPVLRELSLYVTMFWSILRFRPQILWSALWFPGAWLATYCYWPAGLKTVFSAYGSEIIPNPLAGLKQWVKAQLMPLRKRVFARFGMIFALSSYTRAELLAMGVAPEKMAIIPGGVDSHWFEIARAGPSEPESPTLLTVARLDEHKGHDVVLKALPHIVARHPGLRYVMIGPSVGNWPRLEALAAELGISSHVDYRGVVSEEELLAAYASADLFVMPSRVIQGRHVEGFGLVFLEAAAAGIPSVAGNSGGIPDAVEHGVTGLLVEPESPAEVASAICSLLEDPARLQAMGQAAKKRARGFVWSAIAERMITALEPS